MAYIMCWNCQGNGIEALPPTWNSTVCTECNGTGCDAKKTKETTAILESEKTYPLPVNYE